MKDRTFAEALWSDSWESAQSDDSEQGSISFSKENGIEIQIPFGNITEDYVLFKNPEHGRIDALYGYTRDNKYLLVQDSLVTHCRTSYPGGTERTLSGRRMLICRQPFDIGKAVQSVRIFLRGLADWFGETPLKVQSQYHSDPLQFKRLEAVLDMEDAKPVLLYEKANYRVLFEHNFIIPGSISFSEFTLKHEVFLSVAFNEERQLDDVLANVVRPISKFFSLCEGALADIERLEFFFAGLNTPVELLENRIYSEPIYPVERHEKCLSLINGLKIVYPLLSIDGLQCQMI